MKKLLSKLPTLPHRDKIFHALGCFAIAAIIALALPDVVYGFQDQWIGAGVAANIGIGKEVADYFGEGTADVWDLVADAVGIAAAVALLSLL